MRAIGDLLAMDALRAGQRVRLRVATGSMLPALRPGDVIEVEGVPPAINDVGVVWSRDSWIVHRVVWRDSERCILCGDATGQRPHHERASAVVGRVCAVRRSLKSWLLFGRWHIRRLVRPTA